MKKNVKRFLTLLLSASMVAGTVPLNIMAAPETQTAEGTIPEADESNNQAAGEAAPAVESTPAEEAAAPAETAPAEETTPAADNGISTFSLNEQEYNIDELKDVIKNLIFHDRGTNQVSLDSTVNKDEVTNATDEVLEENQANDLVSVTYNTDQDNNVSTMSVERDDTLTTAMDELDTINEQSDEPVDETTMETVYAHYAELQSYYEANPDYFGIACPYFTSKDTEASPIGSLLSIAGISQEAIDGGYVSATDVDSLVQGFNQALPAYVANMGSTLLAQKDKALAQIDDAMTPLEKLLVLNDWLGDTCNFDMTAIMDQQDDGSTTESTTEIQSSEDVDAAVAETQEKDTLLQSTAFGALVQKNCVCMGYTAAYNYLIQWAFPDIYKTSSTDADGNATLTWKTKTDVNGREAVAAVEDDPSTPDVDETKAAVEAIEPTYMVDFVKITWDADVSMLGEESHFDEPHFFSAVKLDDKWYYVDSCYDDIYVECMGRNRVETDGNMVHSYFLISDTSLRDQFDGNFSAIDTLYKDLATNTDYEESWFTNACGPVYHDANYWYYVKNTSTYDTGGSTGGNGNYQEGADQLIARPRSSAVTDDSDIVLVDYETGKGTNVDGTTATTGGDLVVAGAKTDSDVNEENYAGLMHTTALYENALYLNVDNEILKYDLATGAITKVKEYNTVSATQNTDNPFTGMSFSVAPEGTEGIVHTVKEKPIAALCVKDDNQLYVSIATNYCYVSDYAVEETNYNSEYMNYKMGDQVIQQGGDNDNEEFMWSANFVDTLDMSHLAGTEHTYAPVVVAPTCEEEGYTENRCTTCGISDGAEPTDVTEATGHHFLHVDDLTYTKDDDGNRITVEGYVCTKCLNSKDELGEGETAGHVYGEPVFTWAEDFSSCTAEFKCASCEGTELDCTKDDATIDQTVDCEITQTEATGDDGIITTTYKAVCNFNDKDYESTKDEKSDHVHEYAYTDNGDGTHTGKCKHEGCTKTVTGKCTFEDYICTKCGAKDREALTPATDFKAAPAGKQKVALSWTEVKDAEGYIIYSQKGKDGKYAYCGMTDKTTYTDKAALDSDNNFYWIYPYFTNKTDIRITGRCTGYVYAKGITPAVENLKAGGVEGGIKLRWDKSTDAEGYLIYGKRGNGTTGYIGWAQGGDTTTFIDLKAISTDYNFYWVYPYHVKEDGTRAVGFCPKYVYAKASSCTVSNLKASSVKGGVKLTWKDSAKSDGYLIYGREQGGEYGFRGMTTKGTTFTDKNASKSAYTFYWVFAYTLNDDGTRNIGVKSY